MKKNKIVFLFDADGVTITGNNVGYFLEKEFGVPRKETSKFFSGVFKDCLVGKSELKVILTPYLKSWGWKKSTDEFITYWFRKENKVNKSLLNKIKDLRSYGIPCYLVSNQENNRARYIEREMNFKTYFDHCFFSCDLGVLKTDVKFFENIYHFANNTPKKMFFYFDDDISNIFVAQTFGVSAHLYKTLADFTKVARPYLQQDITKKEPHHYDSY